jgi:hypothetical protein
MRGSTRNTRIRETNRTSRIDLEFGEVGACWEHICWRVDVRYVDLIHQIRPADHMGRNHSAAHFISTTQQRVLALLFGQPDRSFHATEIIRLAGSGSAAALRAPLHGAQPRRPAQARGLGPRREPAARVPALLAAPLGEGTTGLKGRAGMCGIMCVY